VRMQKPLQLTHPVTKLPYGWKPAERTVGRHFDRQQEGLNHKNPGRAPGHTVASLFAVALLAYELMTTTLLNVFHCTATNIGDRMCGPAQYLWPKMAQVAPIPVKMPADVDTVIFGGGQIFSQIDMLSDKNTDRKKPAKLVAWGVGLPVHGAKDETVIRVARRFDLFSTRNYDWRDELQFVPCASCLCSLFDLSKSPTHDLVIYNHRKKPGVVDVPDGVPTMTNSLEDPRIAVDFIASGDTIVTSSYHGVYWAQLLGRRVVCIPYGTKFLTFQNAPTFALQHSWMTSLRSAVRFPPMLEEYRSLNQAFAKNVEQLWNG
jgi:Polysaccharide pyruvyl transferase